MMPQLSCYDLIRYEQIFLWNKNVNNESIGNRVLRNLLTDGQSNPNTSEFPVKWLAQQIKGDFPLDIFVFQVAP